MRSLQYPSRILLLEQPSCQVAENHMYGRPYCIALFIISIVMTLPHVVCRGIIRIQFYRLGAISYYFVVVVWHSLLPILLLTTAIVGQKQSIPP